jgi:hypothetical protein
LLRTAIPLFRFVALVGEGSNCCPSDERSSQSDTHSSEDSHIASGFVDAMGCGSSSGIKEEPLDAAQAVQPGAGGNKGNDGSGGKTLPALSAASNTAGAATVDPAAVGALLAAHRWAEAELAPEPASVAAAAALELNGGGDSGGAGNVDAIAGSYVVADDLGLVVAHLSSSDACTLFSESKAGALEITPQSLAELLLLAGGTDELLRSLKRLDAQGVKCASMAELGPVLMHLQGEEAAALASAAGESLPADVVAALLAAREVLANPACELYPYALVPRITAAPAVGAAGEHDEELELDFSHVNQLMVQTRTRLTFLAPRFLVQLVHACGRGGPLGRLVVLDVLNGLALQERSFEAPSALLRAALLHRAAALEAQRALQTKMAAADPSAKVVPEALQQQVAPMVSSLAAVEPSCVSLQPLLAPLIPTLSNLTPTLRHLQAYLARFLPLLQESAAAATAAGTAPGDDAATAQIVSAYLIPFLKLTQPWIIQLRPYLAGLQPFFEALQPNLVLTHAAFGTLQPFLASLAPHLGVNAGGAGAADSAADDSVAAVSVDKVSPFLLSTPSFVTALERVVTVLAVLHPLLRQLHPLCEGLLSFCAELGVFLAQLQSLLDLLAQYQTLPLEPDTATKEDEGEDEQELSSIARPWFPDEEGDQAADATATAQLSAPQFLAKHGRFLGKLSPYVTQLRPFAADIDAFVQKFAPFLAQLAPFYKEQLKHVVKPMLLLLLPTNASSGAGAAASSSTAAAPEIDEATLQRLLSS